MRGKFLIAALAALMLESGIAQAEDMTAENASDTSTASAPSSAEGKVKKEIPASGETSASLPKNFFSPNRTSFKFSLFSRSSVGRDSVADGNQSKNNPTSSNTVSVKYQLTDTRTIGVGQDFNYTYPTPAAVNGKAKINDLHIGYNDSNLASFAGDGSVTGIFRIYLPTGEDSRFKTKQQGAALAWFIVDKPVGKWEFEFHSINLYYNQTQNGYTSISDGKLKMNANADYEDESWLGVSYKLNSWVTFFHTAGTDNTWNRGIPEDGVQRTHSLELDTGVTFKPIKEMSLSASLYDNPALFNAERPLKLYADKDTFYRLTLVASL